MNGGGSKGKGRTPADGDASSGKDAWSHIDERGGARMVDISAKKATHRRARAEARIRMRSTTRRDIVSGDTPKGSVITVARVAGIQAAKRTGELIPLCHTLPVEEMRLDFSWLEEAGGDEAVLVIESEAVVSAKTGVEMEALTAAAVAALTVYDMCKAVDRGMVVESVRLLEKSGGRSGRWVRPGSGTGGGPAAPS